MSRTREKLPALQAEEETAPNQSNEVISQQDDQNAQDLRCVRLTESEDLIPKNYFMHEGSSADILKTNEDTSTYLRESSNNLLNIFLTNSTVENENATLYVRSEKLDTCKNGSSIICTPLHKKKVNEDCSQNFTENHLQQTCSLFGNDLFVKPNLPILDSNSQRHTFQLLNLTAEPAYNTYCPLIKNRERLNSFVPVPEYVDEVSEFDWLKTDINIPNNTLDNFQTVARNTCMLDDRLTYEKTLREYSCRTENVQQQLSDHPMQADTLTSVNDIELPQDCITSHKLIMGKSPQPAITFCVSSPETESSTKNEIGRHEKTLAVNLQVEDEDKQLLDVVSEMPECPEIVTEKEAHQNEQSVLSEPVGFILWALKNLLPNGKQLHDKASILHATADYIEQLHSEMRQSFQHSGLKEEDFLNRIQKDLSLRNTGQHKSKKKSSVKTDENKVKRPANPFIRFSVEFRKMVANDFPGRNNKEVSQLLGSIWRRMSDEEKKPFITKFYAELHQTRKDYPDWNYSTKKGIQHLLNLNDMQPERLRPRNSKPQISYKELFSRYPTRPKTKKKETLINKLKEVFWVQCDSCNKWRKLPAGMELKQLPDRWTCSMNTDCNYNSCNIEEEKE